MENNKAVLFELNIENDRCIFPNTISDAIIDANKELKDLEDKLNETLETIRLLTPECDKLDYILSASSGALCGIIDVFLVGKPGESPLGDITDKWFAIAIKAKLNIPVTEFDKSVNELALKLFEKGYDVRFQTTQAIPVFINEMVVRLLYSIRRLIGYYISVPKKDRSWGLLWKSCEPFSNATVKRMLTVAHGTFCIIDIGDATIRGFEKGIGSFNVVEFFMRLNIVGVGRLTISLYGEAKRGIQRSKANNEAIFMKREKVIIDDYMEGLKILSKTYDDKLLMTFVSDFKSSNAYKESFNKSVELAKLRNVPENERIKSKADIDCYFRGGSLK